MRRLWRGLKWLVPRLILVWVVGVLLLLAAIYLYGRFDRAETVDVIVVLGAGLRADDRPGPAMYRRTAQAADLYARGVAATIICTGGYGLRNQRSEADACRELLVAEGVPEEVILLEDQSRSTEENALYTRELMSAEAFDRAVLVSDGYHLLRATWIFSMAGVDNVTSPADDPPPLNLFSSVVRELLAFHWQVFKTVFNLPVTYVSVL